MKVDLKRGVVELYLAKKNLSQNWLASRLGISSGYMSQLLTCKRHPSPKVRARIMDHFNWLGFDDLFEIQK